MNLKKIGVIGLGKLGTPLSLFLASKGFSVYGYDTNKEIRNKLKKKINPFEEKEINNYIKKYSKKFYISESIEENISETEISFIILPTPSGNDGVFKNDYIVSALKKIIKAIPKNRKFHLINITSTVMPETCNKIFSKIIKKSKTKIGLSYNPHFIALGSVIENMENPDLLLIGSDEKRTTNVINKIYKKVYLKKNMGFISNLNLYEAEISKIAVNSYVTMKISFSNFISNIVQSSNFISDADKILGAIAKDTRIGKKYLSVGTKFSGPCFPRDNIALTKYCHKINSSYFLPKATDLENNLQINRYLKLFNKVIKYNKLKKPKIGILGITYKPNTSVTEESPGIDLINRLKDKYDVSYFDPYISQINLKVKKEITLKNLIIKNDIIFLCYEDKNFKIKKNLIKLNRKKKFLIDLWNFHKQNSLKNIEIINVARKTKINF